MTSITNAVGAGLVASLGRPGGNMTGISNLNERPDAQALGPLSRDPCRGQRVIASLGNPANPSTRGLVEVMRGHTAAFGATVNPFEAKAAGEPRRRIRWHRQRAIRMLLLIVPDNLLHRSARANRVAGPQASHPDAVDHPGAHRRRRLPKLRSAAARPLSPLRLFRERILDGANPGDMPVEQPTRFPTLHQRQDRGTCSASGFHRRCLDTPTR